MSEEIGQVEGGDQQQVQVLVDERELRTTYSNTYRIQTLMEEVVLEIGFNMQNPNQQGTTPQVLYKITDRVIFSYSTAKRLAASLTQLVKRYEQQFGEIRTPGQR